MICVRIYRTSVWWFHRSWLATSAVFFQSVCSSSPCVPSLALPQFVESYSKNPCVAFLDTCHSNGIEIKFGARRHSIPFLQCKSSFTSFWRSEIITMTWAWLCRAVISCNSFPWKILKERWRFPCLHPSVLFHGKISGFGCWSCPVATVKLLSTEEKRKVRIPMISKSSFWVLAWITWESKQCRGMAMACFGEVRLNMAKYG